MSKISAALIMKNEEENLPRLLKSIVGKFDEIIVVDTGSTDRSIEISKEFGCRVYKREWNGFADARNYAMSRCSGEWIWHFDADFELEEKEFEKFKKVVDFLEDPSITALYVKVKNYAIDGNIKSVTSQSFIHRNLETVYWEGNIHEALILKEGRVHDFNIYVNHYGYQESSVMKEKGVRNLKLIKKDLELYKSDERKYFIKLFYLFQTIELLASYDAKYLEEFDEYIGEYETLRKKFDNDGNMHFFIYYAMSYIASIYERKGELQKALQYILQLLQHRPVFPDAYIVKAKIDRKLNTNEVGWDYLNFLKEVELYERQHFKRDNAMVIVDFYGQLDAILESAQKEIIGRNDLIEELERGWKEERLKYYALLLAGVYHEQNRIGVRDKLLKKLFLRFTEDEKVLQHITTFYFNIGLKERAVLVASKLHELNEKNLVANKVLALDSMEKGEYEKALYHLSRAILYTKDTTLLPYYLDILEKCGFHDEAENLKKRFKN